MGFNDFIENLEKEMEWLSPFITAMVFLIWADLIFNDSYHGFLFRKNRQSENPYFKSKFHQFYHEIINILTVIVAILVLIKWIFF